MNTNQMSDKEKEYVEYLNSIVNDPEPQVTPMLRMKHISHLDLDGYGSTLLSEILALFYPIGGMSLETKNILPNKLMSELEDTFEHIDDYDLIVITDLAINEKIVNLVNTHPQGNKVRVFDHHVCDIENLPENFVVSDKSPIKVNKLTCATELYYNFIRNDKIYGLIHNENVRRALGYFVECIRIYDTFEFWDTRNDPINEIDITYYDAPRLNTLFHIMERDEFKEYIKNYIFSSQWERLTLSTDQYPWISKILELENYKNTKYVESAIRRMVKVPFKYTIYKNEVVYDLDYLCGVIFAEKSSPVIANTALERHTDIDFCAVVSNNQVSIYTNKENIDVSQIAKIFGGGGHKEAAGFTIPYINSIVFNMEHFAKIIECAGQLMSGQVVFEDLDVTDTN